MQKNLTFVRTERGDWWAALLPMFFEEADSYPNPQLVTLCRRHLPSHHTKDRPLISWICKSILIYWNLNPKIRLKNKMRNTEQQKDKSTRQNTKWSIKSQALSNLVLSSWVIWSANSTTSCIKPQPSMKNLSKFKVEEKVPKPYQDNNHIRDINTETTPSVSVWLPNPTNQAN